MRIRLGIVTVLFAITAGAVEAQTVRRVGRGDTRLDTRLEEVLASQPRIMTRDTFLARYDTLHGPVLSLGNRLVLEGTVIGDLTVVDANVYVRPTARILGNVLNLGSGLYRSELATISGRVEDHPLAPYHVEREADVVTIAGDVEYSLLKLDPAIPTANRVTGIRPRLGAALRLPPLGRTHFELYGWGAYAFERDGWRESLEGGAEVRVRRGFTHIAAGLEETTATNDAWIRSDLNNTLSFLFKGKDYRNYFEADRQYLTVARELIRAPHAAVASLRLQREDAESLPAGDAWSVSRPDSIRPNPAIDRGVLTSVILGLRGEWGSLTAVAAYDGRIEVAPGGFDNKTSFNAFDLSAEWAMQGLANHTLEIEGKFQGPLPGTDVLPRQRWSMMGGSSTLYTFEVGEFMGDRLVYVESEYSIPLERARLPVIGRPAIEFLHVVGLAWTQGHSRDLEQNVGVRLQFPIPYLRFVVNPADLDDTKISAGVSFPRRAYPWERKVDRSPLK